MLADVDNNIKEERAQCHMPLLDNIIVYHEPVRRLLAERCYTT